MLESTIDIAPILGSSLHTRDEADSLFESVKMFCAITEVSNQQFIFNFSDVNFVSRSFADQFHKNKIYFQNKYSCLIQTVCMNNQVFDILETVSRTQVKKIKLKDYPINEFESIEGLYYFLS